MVHRSAGIQYLATADSAKDHNKKRGYGDRNKVRGFTHWRKCSWYELDLGVAGKLNASAARNQEGERTPRRYLVHSMSRRWRHQRYFP